MKNLIYILLCSVFLISSLPTFAITSDTYVLPIVGEASEKANDFVKEKIEEITIKLLPRKVFNIELLEAERTFTPNFLRDHFGLWTSPLRTKYKDLKWFLPVSGVLTTLLLTDNDFEGALTNNYDISKTQTYITRTFGEIAGYAPIVSTPGVLIGTGFITKNKKIRETGVLQYKALAHATLIYLAASRIAGRNKPNNETKGRGEFFEGGTSFPSGHATNSFALASVAAHEYSDKPWVPILAYSLAALSSGSRALQGVHFPSDVFCGAVVGFLIGKYVVKHNSKYASSLKEKKKEDN